MSVASMVTGPGYQ